MRWQERKEKYGQIKRNQVWQKEDTERQMVVLGPGKNRSWKVQFLTGGSNRTHTVKEITIYRFYDRVE